MVSKLDAALGAWMAAERDARQMSQEAVAHQMQLGQPVLSKIERGQRRLTVEELLIWANALGLGTTDVCSGLDKLRAQFLPGTSIWDSSNG